MESIALNSVNFRDGFIHPSYEVDEEKLRNSLRIILFHIFKFLDNIDQLKQEISRLESKGHIDGPVIVPIDHVFDVKGFGTVVMDVIKQGSIKVYYLLKSCQVEKIQL